MTARESALVYNIIGDIKDYVGKKKINRHQKLAGR
jgi:hypothetical protein